MNDKKKTRSVSEETQIRKLLLDLTNQVLALNEQGAATSKMLKARFDDVDAELAKLKQNGGKHERELKAVAMLANDSLKKTNDLHAKVIGSADALGTRLHDLEIARSQNGGRTRRPPRG